MNDEDEPVEIRSEIRFIEDLIRLMDELGQTDYLYVLDRNRPYDGQPHTDLGRRGQQEIRGITMRDLRDCFIRGCYDASGLSPEDYPTSIYGLPWDEIDPMAICQNMICWVERYMGIYPNLNN